MDIFYGCVPFYFPSRIGCAFMILCIKVSLSSHNALRRKELLIIQKNRFLSVASSISSLSQCKRHCTSDKVSRVTSLFTMGVAEKYSN